MKRYSFQLTKKEVLEFSVRAVWEQERLRPLLWLFIAALCVLELFLLPRTGVMVTLAVLLMLAGTVCYNFYVFKRELCEKTRTVWVEDGMLKVEFGSYGEAPCSGFKVVRVTKNLLMLGHFQAKKRLAWYVLPLRVFEGPQEREAFLEQIRRESAVLEETKERREEDEIFHFRFQVDEGKWLRLLAGATEVINAGTFGRSKKRSIFWGIYGAVFVASAVSLFVTDAGQTALAVMFLMAVVFLILLRNGKEDPEKKIRRQIKAGSVQNDVCGEWEVTVSERGVTQSGSGIGMAALPWEEISWLVETKAGFYLFQKDKKHFIMIPGECLESREQAEALKRLCAERRVTVVRGKKVKPMPGWSFFVLLAAVVAAYLGAAVWLAVRDSARNAERQQDGGSAQQDWIEEFDPADYPDYVPLDEQAEVLRSLGFTLTEEAVEETRSNMEEYGMRAWVEGYPYTWLLSGMGTPLYDENWEIAGYSEEVLWFDFEGWDISTDYIEVLEGMKVLAQGSSIDSVKNIREDTDSVNWEEGSGEITVRLEWRGQEYSWKMDVENDWIDGEVLGIFNSLLEQDGTAERFYATGDGGQGALVFYCTQDWAEKFEKATGLELNCYVAGRKVIL